MIGPWFLFNTWLKNSQDGGSAIFTDNVKAVICGSAQVLSTGFVGTSTDGRYADLTAELPTASGYTVGGILIPSKTVTLSGGIYTLNSDPWSWTISSVITGAKYCVLYDDTSANKDLICAVDLDIEAPGTNTVTLAVGVFLFTPTIIPPIGIVDWKQS